MRKCMTQQSLLDKFLEELEASRSNDNFRQNASLFLEVCQMHGKAYAFHHDQLVNKYIEQPAEGINETEFQDLTASGPPLPVLLKSLERLRDLRLAKKRVDIPSRYDDLERLKEVIA